MCRHRRFSLRLFVRAPKATKRVLKFLQLLSVLNTYMVGAARIDFTGKATFLAVPVGICHLLGLRR
jgi:hypothetical protein